LNPSKHKSISKKGPSAASYKLKPNEKINTETGILMAINNSTTAREMFIFVLTFLREQIRRKTIYSQLLQTSGRDEDNTLEGGGALLEGRQWCQCTA
jgi:hypothetical protein